MQVYKGLPLLTAQPSPEDIAKVPHRLYACLAPNVVCSAAKWRDMALAEIERALDEKKLPIIVGGTGFYIKTMIKGLSPIPDIPHGLRAKISTLQKSLGNPGFHTELQKRDPLMAKKLHPFNTQRLIRAFEVLEATGKSLSEWQDIPRVGPPAHLKFLLIHLLPPRDLLYKNCNIRFEKMVAAGAVEEVRVFKESLQNIQEEVPLTHALGYPELTAHLGGHLDLRTAIGDGQTATRHYAKRQVTWFRHQIEADIVLNDSSPETVTNLLQQIT